MKHLRTVDAVVRELGGNKQLARMIECTPANITSWLSKGKIPATYYWMIVEELEDLGCVAPRSIWNFRKRKSNAHVDAA